MQIKTLCLFAGAALVLSGPAFAQPSARVSPGDTVTITRDGPELNIARAAPKESIEVKGRALMDGTPVAVRGTVSDRVGTDLIVAHQDGDVIARIRATGTPESQFYGHAIATQIGIGDHVTIFGDVKKGDGRFIVRSDAVYDDNNGTLYLPNEGDQFAASPFYNPTRHIANSHAFNKRYRVL